MSRVRTHFCTLVARRNGAMPAFTNSRFGSSNSRGALGTAAWSRSVKNFRNLRRISAVSMVLPVVLTISGGVESESLPQLGLPLVHARPHLVTEVPDRAGELVHRVLHALRGQDLRLLLQPSDQPDASQRPDDEPDQPPHFTPPRLAALRSAFISSRTRRSTSCRWLFAIARRTPYENAAAFTSGPPAVAENSDISAAALVVTVLAFSVMVSTFASCAFVVVTVVVTSPISGTLESETPLTSSRVSSSTLPSFRIG